MLRTKTKLDPNKQSLLQRIHIDGPLLAGLLALMAVGLLTIYSAGGQDWGLVQRQLVRLGVAMAVMFALAQIPPLAFRRMSVYFYIVGVLMLVGVLLFGVVGKGAQRWLDLGGGAIPTV